MNAQKHYLGLGKHFAVYGGGLILARFASFLLLPLYTSYLRPADYGVIAILDFFSALMGFLIARGMLSAVTRHHFEQKSDEMQRSVWWTGMVFIAMTGSTLVSLGTVFCKDLAEIALGATVIGREEFFLLMLAKLWFSGLGHLPLEYFRVRKWSNVFVSFNVGRLLVNIALNVYFLTVLEWGVYGLLMGNLLTEALNTFGVFLVFSRNIGRFSFNWNLGTQLWRFAAPLIFTGILSAIMHQTNVYLLRVFADLNQVGLFSIAYLLAQGMNSLVLMPFEMIWSVVIYEIAQQDDAKKIYVQVCEYFIYIIALLLLGVALFAKPLLQVIVAPDFLPAHSLVPIVCLAFVFFSLHLHFRLPALLAKRTGMIIPVTVFAVLVNIGANLTLIPMWAEFGAAWASVLGFMAYSIGGLFWYRRIERYDYPLVKLSLVGMGMVGSFLIYYLAQPWLQHQIWSICLGALIWVTWAICLSWRFIIDLGGVGEIKKIGNMVLEKSMKKK